MRSTLVMVGKGRDSPAKFSPSLDRPANFCPGPEIFCPTIHTGILVTGLSRRFFPGPDCSVALSPGLLTGHLIDQATLKPTLA